MENHGFSVWGVLGAFAVGATAGAVTALLLAPRSGAETRKTLSSLPTAVKEAYAQGKEAGIKAFAENQQAAK